MKRMKRWNRVLCMALCLAMVFSLFSLQALAVEYEAPSAGMAADDNIITGSAYAASTVALSILGVNVTSSNGAGIYNGGGTTDAYGTDSSNLGIFGSDINDSPDPYLYNYFYNLHSTQTGGGDYGDEDYASWSAIPYTLRWDNNKQGAQGQASGSVTISLMGDVITANPAFFYEPDIFLGEASNYAEELAAYQETYNADYDPVFCEYISTSGTRSDGLGLEYNMFEMSEGLISIAKALEQISEQTGKTTRYEDSAYEIATNFDKYNRGLYYWAQSQFASGALTELNYASSLSYDADLDEWAVTKGSDRAAQYASGIGNDIYDLLQDGYTFADGTKVTASEIVSTSDAGGPGGRQGTAGGQQGGPGGQQGGAQQAGGQQGGGQQGGSSTNTGFYLTTSQLIEILTVTGSDGTTYAGVVIGKQGDDAAYEELANADITFLGNLPACVYGMTMQTCENGMGIAFYLSYFYYAQNHDLSPVNMIAYWMEHFYHVSDVAAMQTVITNMLAEADLPAEYYYNGSVNMDEYDDGVVEDLIAGGIAYYHTIEDELAGEGNSALLWNTLDETIGIGSDGRTIDNNQNTAADEASAADADDAAAENAENTEGSSLSTGWIVCIVVIVVIIAAVIIILAVKKKRK